MELTKYINGEPVTIWVDKEYYEYIKEIAKRNLGKDKEDDELAIEYEIIDYLEDEFQEEYENQKEQSNDYYSEINSWLNKQTGV